MRKLNNIEEHVIETPKEKRWFSIIKEVAKNVEYGVVEAMFTIKDGEVVGLKVKEEGRTYNIGG